MICGNRRTTRFKQEDNSAHNCDTERFSSVLRTSHLKTTLKRLGHAILGNFSTDQMIIELNKI